MSDIISIHKELIRLSKALAGAVNEFSDVVVDAAEKRSAYDILWAQSMLQTPDEKTQKIKEALATEACAVQMLQARVAEATRDALKERIRALETVLSVQQSRLRYLESTEKDFN
jgi:hypothetical protein